MEKTSSTDGIPALEGCPDVWRQAFEHAGWGVILVSADHQRLEAANPAFARMLGYSVAELQGCPFARLLSPDQAESLARRLPPDAEAGHEEFESLLTRKDGERLPVLVDRTPVRDGTGRILRWVALVAGCAERKRAEAALQRQKDRLETVFNLVPAQIWVKDDRNRFLKVNRQVCRDLGLAPEEIEGRSAEELFPAAAGMYFQDDQEVLRTGQAKTGIVERLPSPSGELRWVRTAKLPIPGGPGEPAGVLAFVEDITEMKRLQRERRRMELEVLHTQKIESLGQMAGSLGHDMNNVLAAILGVASALQVRYPDDPALAKSLETILQAATRGRDLVQNLASFSRRDQEEPQPVDLNRLVREEMGRLGRGAGARWRLEADLDEGLPPVLGEPASLANALTHLSQNALDAMPDGGALCFATRALADGRVELSVADTGIGMSEPVRAQAMDPFFTTKPRGKGTGLGLAIVHSAVAAHGGTVELQSAPGDGATVLLRFPGASAEGAAPEPAGAEPAGARSRRILLVDDDELVRATAPLMLEHMGHQVMVAAHAAEALELLEDGMAVDLLVLDHGLPGLTGAEVLGRIQALRPHLPILLATARRDAAVEAGLRGRVNVWLLPKPYAFNDLSAKLEEIFPK